MRTLLNFDLRRDFMFQTVYIASDHAGFKLKSKILQHFKELPLVDLGCPNEDRVDYPDFAHKLMQKIALEPADSANFKSMGILICGSGQGVAMTANKESHIRAALCWNLESATLSRQHNNANVLCLGERLIEEPVALEIVDVFFKTKFEGGRHAERVKKI